MKTTSMLLKKRAASLKKPLTVAAVCLALLGGGWIVWAQVGGSGVIYGCLSPSGFIRGIDETTGACRNGDVALAWYTRQGADQAFLSRFGKAADADTLDGLDSGQFVRADSLQIPERARFYSLSAADFTPQRQADLSIDTDGHLVNRRLDRSWSAVAPLHLPNGVEMTGIGFTIDESVALSSCILHDGHPIQCFEAFMCAEVIRFDVFGARDTLASNCFGGDPSGRALGISFMGLSVSEVINNQCCSYYVRLVGTSEWDDGTQSFATTSRLRFIRAGIGYRVNNLLQ